jgi:hypothetical protein
MNTRLSIIYYLCDQCRIKADSVSLWVCLYVALPLLGNNSVKNFRGKFWRHYFLGGPCRIKENYEISSSQNFLPFHSTLFSKEWCKYFHVYKLTSSQKFNSRPTEYKVSRTSLNRFRQIPPLIAILSHMNPILNFLSHPFRCIFVIFLYLCLGLPSFSSYKVLRLKYLLLFPCLLHSSTILCSFI